MPKVQPEVYCRPPWQRMMRIHELVQKGRYPNCTRLAEEFEVSTRTAKRDVDFMKCRLNLPIEYDVRRNGYYYTKYLRGSFSVYTGRGDYEVVLEFDAWAAESIRGRRWHASQELTEMPAGRLRLAMRLTSLKEVDRWVLSWGAHVTVVRPKALAVRLRQMALDVRRRYTRAGSVRSNGS
jgi:predicted DNA-binding transcriptional regulator YafY